ncbi:hypothetical protein [Nocardia salmonicida]|uniref:hypothetical protein n=1 Tax=Nocardia salmonicida TaxID=53431 RepID=UPI0033F68175
MLALTAAAIRMVAPAGPRYSDVLTELLRIANDYEAATDRAHEIATGSLIIAATMWQRHGETPLEGVRWQLADQIDQHSNTSWSWRNQSEGVVDGGLGAARAQEFATAAQLVAAALRAIETRFATA